MANLPPLTRISPLRLTDGDGLVFVDLHKFQCDLLATPVNGQVPKVIRSRTIELVANICLDNGTKIITNRTIIKSFIMVNGIPGGQQTIVPHPYLAPDGNPTWSETNARDAMIAANDFFMNSGYGMAGGC